MTGMTGDLETCMAGMNCGTPSDYGWNALRDNATVFLSCKDELAFDGMRLLHQPQGKTDMIFDELKILRYFFICSQVPMSG